MSKTKDDDVGTDDVRYEARIYKADGKYARIFANTKQGPRIYCSQGKESCIARSYRKWLIEHGHAKNPLVRVKIKCDDGKAGVWWLGEKEAAPPKTIWQPLAKVA